MKKTELNQIARQAAAVGRGEIKAARVTRIELLPDGNLTEIPMDAEEFRKIQSAAWDAKTEAARIRQQLGMTQPEFASLLGIPIATLHNWESEPSQPSGAARTLLLLAEKHPDLVKEAAERAMGSSLSTSL